VHSFLAAELEVSDEEALALARTIGDIQHAALRNPLAIYPMDVDMSVLYLLGEFCADGRFEIT
jgi:hypothetical protein